MLPKEHVIKIAITKSDVDELESFVKDGKKLSADKIQAKLHAMAYETNKPAVDAWVSAQQSSAKRKMGILKLPGLKSLLEKMKTRQCLTGLDLDLCKSIADSYFAGEGVRRNIQKAFNFFKLAADSGDRFSQYNVAILAKEYSTEISETDTTSIY